MSQRSSVVDASTPSPTKERTPQTVDEIDQKTPVDIPPDGGYGWVIVSSVAVINAHSWGLNSAFAVFLSHYLNSNYFPGATSLDYAFIGGLAISMALFVSPLATLSTKAFGTRATLLIGVFLETASFIGASFTKRIWQLYLSQGLCFGFGLGFLFVASVAVPPQWFSKKRSLANACGACGSGLGGLVYSLATNAMIQNIGLAWALRTLGIISAVVNTIASLLLRDRNKQVGSRQVPWDNKLLLNKKFIFLSGWSFFSMLGYIVLNYSLPSYAVSIGLTQSQASIVGALFQLGQFLGRPPVGYFSDTIGRLNMAILMTFLEVIWVLFVWIFADSYGVLIFFAVVGGSVAGTFWATVAPVVAEVTGIQNLPAGLTMTWLIIVCPTLFSEPIALEMVARTSLGYLSTQLFAGFMYLAAAISLYCVRFWQIGDLQKPSAADSSVPRSRRLWQQATALRKV